MPYKSAPLLVCALGGLLAAQPEARKSNMELVGYNDLQARSAYQPVIQYGIGLRGRPLLSEDGRLRLTVRLEATRFRRAYLNDTLLLASAGLAF